MKKFVITWVLLLTIAVSYAQSFEGTITYTMTMKVTDLTAKRDIAEAKKEVASNPKADKQTLMIANFEENLSGKVIIELKGNRSNVQIRTGLMNGQAIVYQGDKNISYLIDHSSKHYSINDPKMEDESATTVTKTSETETIFGHLCTKYIVVKNGPSNEPSLTYVWSTTEIKDIDLSKSVAGSIGAGSPLVFNAGEGVPLRIQRKMQHGLLTSEVVSIERGSIATSEFEIPAGYTSTKN